jgi:membrane-bound hydrogenase subunit beta
MSEPVKEYPMTLEAKNNMEETQAVQAELLKRFPQAVQNVRVQRARRIYADVAYDSFSGVFEEAVGPLKFVVLCAITGLDLGERLGVVYHLARESGVVLSLSTSVPKSDSVIRSVTDHFPAADLYERELADLLGITVTGLLQGPRYPLPDDWPEGQFPLRKDWKRVEPAGGQGEVRNA